VGSRARLAPKLDLKFSRAPRVAMGHKSAFKAKLPPWKIG